MAQFDVFKFKNESHLLLDIQSNILSDLSTRVVIPLVAVKPCYNKNLQRLHPLIGIMGKGYELRTAEISAVPSSILNDHIVNLEDHYRDQIILSFDFLIQGF